MAKNVKSTRYIVLKVEFEHSINDSPEDVLNEADYSINIGEKGKVIDTEMVDFYEYCPE